MFNSASICGVNSSLWCSCTALPRHTLLVQPTLLIVTSQFSCLFQTGTTFCFCQMYFSWRRITRSYHFQSLCGRFVFVYHCFLFHCYHFVVILSLFMVVLQLLSFLILSYHITLRIFYCFVLCFSLCVLLRLFCILSSLVFWLEKTNLSQIFLTLCIPESVSMFSSVILPWAFNVGVSVRLEHWPLHNLPGGQKYFLYPTICHF